MYFYEISINIKDNPSVITDGQVMIRKNMLSIPQSPPCSNMVTSSIVDEAVSHMTVL